MTNADRRFLFIEEGAAFLELEGLDLEREENTMDTTQEHFAPVEAWDTIATGYDRHVAPGEADLATAALKLAGLKGRDRFLDVAAGTGGLTLPAARLGAHVVATDWSAKMIERFEARVRDERLPNAEGKVMDCHALAFPDDTFDVTGSQFGVMLVPDQAKALREMVRVTRPGGRVLLIAYGAPARFEALGTFIDALRAVHPAFEGMPSDPPPLEFQLSDPEVMRQRLVAAGLRDVRVDTTFEERISVRTGQQLWDWCVGSNPIPGMLVGELTEDQRAAMRQRLDETVRARANRGGAAVLTASLNVGVGVK